MKYEGVFPEGTRELLVVDACVFSRQAICHLLLAHPAPIRELAALGNRPEESDYPVTGLVVRLRGILAAQIETLRELAALISRRPVPVALVTDMSPFCAFALLELAGLPSELAAYVRVVPARLRAERLGWLLHLTLRHDCPIPGVNRFRTELSPLLLTALIYMIVGIPELTLARVQDQSIKTIYNRRFAVLRQLRVSGQHALLCGCFVSMGRLRARGERKINSN